MPDPFDDARRSLDEVLAPDLWDEAVRRAAVDVVAPVDGRDERQRHPGRWLAGAAVAALAIGTTAVLTDGDDHERVDSGPVATVGEEPITRFENGDCTFGVRGGPIFQATDGDQPPRLDDQPSVRLGLGASQNALVHVPGYLVMDLTGERVEDVELARGTAQIWFTDQFVQVRWSTGSQDPCDSFTVTVASSDIPATTNEDQNRHAAVTLADGIVLASELGEEPTTGPVVAGDWQLERATVDGEPTDGDGLLFWFSGGIATWSDGCNQLTGTYTSAGPTSIRVADVSTTAVGCEPNPTAAAVQGVMGSTDAVTIDVARDGLDLLLRANGIELRLRTMVDGFGGTEGAADAASLVGTTWIVEGSRVDEGEIVPTDDRQGANVPEFEFLPDTISFDDGCNGQLAGQVEYRGATITVGYFGGTERGCGDELMAQAGQIQTVMAGPVGVAFVGDRLELSTAGAR